MNQFTPRGCHYLNPKATGGAVEFDEFDGSRLVVDTEKSIAFFRLGKECNSPTICFLMQNLKGTIQSLVELEAKSTYQEYGQTWQERLEHYLSYLDAYRRVPNLDDALGKFLEFAIILFEHADFVSRRPTSTGWKRIEELLSSISSLAVAKEVAETSPQHAMELNLASTAKNLLNSVGPVSLDTTSRKLLDSQFSFSEKFDHVNSACTAIARSKGKKSVEYLQSIRNLWDFTSQQSLRNESLRTAESKCGLKYLEALLDPETRELAEGHFKAIGTTAEKEIKSIVFEDLAEDSTRTFLFKLVGFLLLAILIPAAIVFFFFFFLFWFSVKISFMLAVGTGLLSGTVASELLPKNLAGVKVFLRHKQAFQLQKTLTIYFLKRYDLKSFNSLIGSSAKQLWRDVAALFGISTPFVCFALFVYAGAFWVFRGYENAVWNHFWPSVFFILYVFLGLIIVSILLCSKNGVLTTAIPRAFFGCLFAWVTVILTTFLGFVGSGLDDAIQASLLSIVTMELHFLFVILTMVVFGFLAFLMLFMEVRSTISRRSSAIKRTKGVWRKSFIGALFWGNFFALPLSFMLLNFSSLNQPEPQYEVHVRQPGQSTYKVYVGQSGEKFILRPKSGVAQKNSDSISTEMQKSIEAFDWAKKAPFDRVEIYLKVVAVYYVGGSMLALFFGIVTQLFWEDKFITEPIFES